MNEVMMIRRTPSTSISLPIATMQDARLSFRARGVLGLLLTYDDETLISTADLPQHGTEGRDAIRSALAELREFSYVRQTRYQYKDDRGRVLWAWETVVSDAPLPSPENPSSVGSQKPENPSSEMPLVTTPSTHQLKPSDTPELSTAPEDGFSGFLSCITNSSSTSSSDTSYLRAGQARHRVAKGWDQVPGKGPKRPTARERDEAAKAEEASTDPFAATSDDDDPQPADTGSSDTLADRRQQVVARRSTRSKGASEKLAGYFETRAVPQAAEEAAGRFSGKILAKNIAAWRKEGTPDSQIRTMIETYWGGAFRRNLTTPAWQDFINQRGQLLGQSQKASTVVAWEANRLNDAYWT
jgi:hypothetical protein